MTAVLTEAEIDARVAVLNRRRRWLIAARLLMTLFLAVVIPIWLQGPPARHRAVAAPRPMTQAQTDDWCSRLEPDLQTELRRAVQVTSPAPGRCTLTTVLPSPVHLDVAIGPAATTLYASAPLLDESSPAAGCGVAVWRVAHGGLAVCFTAGSGPLVKLQQHASVIAGLALADL